MLEGRPLEVFGDKHRRQMTNAFLIKETEPGLQFNCFRFLYPKNLSTLNA